MADDKVQPEVWRPVPEWEGLYEVSDHGRVKSLPRWVGSRNGSKRLWKGGVLRMGKSLGYPKVTLREKGRAVGVRVHQLVAAVFLSPPPGPVGPAAGEYCVNHLDGDKENNHVANLEWCTREENAEHAKREGLLNAPKGSANAKAKLTDDDVREIRRRVAAGETRAALAQEYGVSAASVSVLVARKTWRHVV